MFRLVTFLYYSFVLYYGLSLDVPEEVHLASKGYGMLFFTIWNLTSQLIYFTLAFFYDMLESYIEFKTYRGQLGKFLDYLFASIIFPITMIVSTLFWIIYGIDRELVYPKVLDNFVPVWYNHVMHTCIIVFSMTEQLFVYHSYPRRKQGLLGVLIYCHAYIVWIHIAFFFINKWPYPLFHRLSSVERLLFMEFTVALGVIAYLVGERMNIKVWGKRETTDKRLTSKAS